MDDDRTCPNCGCEISSDDVICPVCGHVSVPADVVCPICGHDIDPDDIDVDKWAHVVRYTCANCGHGGAFLA